MTSLLAIETSGQSLGVALHTDAGVVFEEDVTAGMIHGRALAPLVEKALGAHGLTVKELEAIAVSLGPGSWTGLRIGLASAKALAWGAGVKLVGVPSFEALALDAQRLAPEHAVLALRDARSEGFFIALFGETSDRPERWIPEDVLRPDAAIEAVRAVMADHSGVPLAVCGDAACLAGMADAAAESGWRLMPELLHIPARATARCGWRRLLGGDDVLRTAAEIHALSPLYLRASDPELKLKK